MLLILLPITLVTASTSLGLFMNPGFANPQCGSRLSSTLSVQHSGDEFYFSPNCRAFFDLIGGNRAEMAVDVLFMCASGQIIEGTGGDDKEMELVFFTSSKGPSIAPGVAGKTEDIGATMQVTYTPKDLVLEASTILSGTWDADKKSLIFEDISCQ